VLDALLSTALFIAAIPAGLAPRRYWPSIDVHVPVFRAALLSAIATFFLAAIISVPAFFQYLHAAVAPAGEKMLDLYGLKGRTGVSSPESTTAAIQLVQITTPMLPFLFIFTTWQGLISLYLTLTGALRMVAWYIDDPWGDPALTMVDNVVRRAWTASRERDARILRERREGTAVPDVLMTGADVGLADADLVVIASRRKPEWDAGAIVVTDDKWFKLGAAVEQQMPGGWRTLYPLTELHHHEVLRRAVRYTLPALKGRQRWPRP
jgi:hypothetical protein